MKTMGGTTTSLTVQQLIDSGCLSRSVFVFVHERSSAPPLDGPGILGQLQHDDSNGEENKSTTHLLNAVKLSLLLANRFYHYFNGKNNSASAPLQLDEIFINLLRDANTAETGDGNLTSALSFDQFQEVTSSGHTRWILLDMDAKDSDARTTPANTNVAALMQSLGTLIYALFSLGAPALDLEDIKGDTNRVIETTLHASKTRRSLSKSLFERLIEAGYPISVSRLLHDMIDRGRTQHPITSFNELIHDLEQMNSYPEKFLHNPENEFYTSTLHFGQRYYGRSKELAKLLEITTLPNEGNTGLDTIFVSGAAGSGKSYLVSAVRRFISSLGFIVLTEKFKRGMEHESREVVSSLFDKIVAKLVEMKDSDNESDIDYSCRATRVITNALDAESLSRLVDFIPSIQDLIPEVVRESSSCTHWQLIFLLSKLLGSVLSLERKIFIVLDDLQWADPTTMGLFSEVLSSICQIRGERQHLVFVGIYRDDEVTPGLLSFTTSFVKLEENGTANVTDIELSTLSLDDVVELVMNEMRLPRRLVSELAAVIYKKTSGHALFCVQLLNSLVNDATIVYSPRNHRFSWDEDKVCMINTTADVASFIVANLKSLPAESFKCLRIFSCFGIQVQSSLLDVIRDSRLAPQGGFEPYLRDLVDTGILEIVGPMVAFSHDLIHEQVYKGIPAKEQWQLHLDIGSFLGSKTSLDASSQTKPINDAIEQLYLSDATDDEDTYMGVSSLVSIATSQINKVGPEFFSDRTQKIRFAGWNLCAGKDAAKLSSFRAAQYFYKHGIAFLGDILWLDDTNDISLKLHEGAAISASALGEITLISMYAKAIINHVQFEESLQAQYLLIGSLTVSGQYQEAVARGVAVLRKSPWFNLPATPTPMIVMQTMNLTEKEALMYNFSQIDDCKRIDSKTRTIMQLVEAIGVACYQIASPWLPLVACETVRFSLQNGICVESGSAFVVFAYFQVFLGKSFDQVYHWGIIAENMLKKSWTEGSWTESVAIKARWKLYSFVLFWYTPLQESITRMQDIYDSAIKLGENETACLSVCLKLRFSFFRGDQLSHLSHSFKKYLKSMVKFSKGTAKFSAMDIDVIDELTGKKSSNLYSIFNDTICDKQSFLADAQSKMNFQIIESAHLSDFFLSFWMGDYDKADKAYKIAMSIPSAKMPKLFTIYHTFYRGILSFYFYRSGKGEKWLSEGKEILDRVELWVKNSKPIFENKLILLEAEHYASMCNVVAAKESYDLSVEVARDNGYVHEQGLAYECKAKYLKSIVEDQDAERCFMSAHTCYMQWGAVAKANKLWKDYDLGSSTEHTEICNTKHEREEDR